MLRLRQVLDGAHDVDQLVLLVVRGLLGGVDDGGPQALELMLNLAQVAIFLVGVPGGGCKLLGGFLNGNGVGDEGSGDVVGAGGHGGKMRATEARAVRGTRGAQWKDKGPWGVIWDDRCSPESR